MDDRSNLLGLSCICTTCCQRILAQSSHVLSGVVLQDAKPGPGVENAFPGGSFRDFEVHILAQYILGGVRSQTGACCGLGL